MCKVSVLVPIFNVEKYLDKCLSSLAGQDLEAMEVICLNDGSTDNSAAIAHRYEGKDSRFRVIDKQNSGYGKTMNLGISLARGEFVGIVESDDFIEEDMFSFLYNLAVKCNADVVKSSFWIHTNGFDIFKNTISDNWYDRVISHRDTNEVFGLNPSIWSNLYKRSFLIDNQITFSETPGASFQDIAWRTKVFACAERVVFTPKAFYHYRRDNVNASVRENGKLFCVRDEYDEAERFLNENKHGEDKYKYLFPWFRWDHYYWNCFERWLSLESRWEFFKFMYKEMLRYEKEGCLNRSFWPKEKWMSLQNMLSGSTQFFFDHWVAFWRKSIILEGWSTVLSKDLKLAIYGAGKVGREAMASLCYYGRRPECFVVSDMIGNESIVENVPVHKIDDLLPKSEDFLIIIATGMSVQSEILELLLEKGFFHIVPFLPEVRQTLRV